MAEQRQQRLPGDPGIADPVGEDQDGRRGRIVGVVWHVGNFLRGEK
jgi:hypothetical protein